MVLHHMEVGMTNRYKRNSDLIKQYKLDKITVIGAGGIGSALIRSAAIMGFSSMDIWDFDELEEHNLSTTLYEEKYLNMNKATIGGLVAKDHNSNVRIKAFSTYNKGDEVHPKVFICTDNMEVRKLAYEEWLKKEDREFFIDMRMGALTMEIVTATKAHDNYMETWLPSDKIPDESCTAKHTIFTANVCAGYGLNQAFNVLQNRPYRDYIWVSLAPISYRLGKLIPNTKKEK